MLRTTCEAFESAFRSVGFVTQEQIPLCLLLNCHWTQTELSRARNAAWRSVLCSTGARGALPAPCLARGGVKVKAVFHGRSENKALLRLHRGVPQSISKAPLELDNLSIHLSKCLQFLFQGRWSNNKFAKKVNLCPKHFSKLNRRGEGVAAGGYIGSCQLLFDLLSP